MSGGQSIEQVIFHTAAIDLGIPTCTCCNVAMYFRVYLEILLLDGLHNRIECSKDLC